MLISSFKFVGFGHRRHRYRKLMRYEMPNNILKKDVFECVCNSCTQYTLHNCIQTETFFENNYIEAAQQFQVGLKKFFI